MHIAIRTVEIIDSRSAISLQLRIASWAVVIE
jgi:hypothetical protein